MSGIAGIIHFDGAPVEPGLLEQMTTAMAYRGPDGISHWVKGPVALGQCMLRTTPESLEETQPLKNEDESLVLVMDGRVDNWEELRKELLGRGAALRNRSDAELVLRAYAIWGRECLQHIDGDFALVIWDARQRLAFCARDRMGNKPFYYHWNGSKLAFASESHPILELPWVKQLPNEGMLAEFLADEWHSRDETLWQGIMRLVAAYCMEINSHGPRPERYWTPDVWAVMPYKTDQEYIDHYRELLLDTVRRLSRSQRHVSYEVSGGLDSSAVFCVAEHLRRTAKLPAPGIEGYTLAFTDDSEANEMAYARAVGEHLGVPVHEISPTIMPLSWYEERANTFKNFPGVPNGVMHLGLMEQASLQGSRVLLNGIGGDEWLGGTKVYYAEEFAKYHWRALYDCFRSDAAEFGAGKAAFWLISYGTFPFLSATSQQFIRNISKKVRSTETREPDWLSRGMLANIHQRRKRFRSSQPQRVRCFGQNRLLGHLSQAFPILAIEQMESLSAHLGVELRRPYHNPALVQLAFSTPERLRLKGGKNKYMHRQAMQGIMPQTILERKSKAEFSIVYRRYLDQMLDSLTAIPGLRPGWIEPDGMARLIRAYHEEPDFGADWILWCIYSCDMAMPKEL